jgi:inorganic triphosphatase YgiF
MGIERELKLALPHEQAAAAEHYLAAQTQDAARDVPLVNIYFDTPAHDLTQARIALRLRNAPGGWLQTLKAAGSAAGGLHSRHEWEMPVAGAALEVDALLLACDDASAAAALRAAAPALTALFKTDFTRRLWRIRFQGALIEAAIDRGEVVAEVGAETRRAPISEIELELIEGDEAALRALADALRAAVPGLVPDDVNKAQRGYRLLAQS